jgi:hypothetical protein
MSDQHLWPDPPPIPSRAAPARTPAAERMRRYRDRMRRGFFCLTIDMHENEIEALIQRGYLRVAHRDEIDAIREAFYAFLDKTLQQ